MTASRQARIRRPASMEARHMISAKTGRRTLNKLLQAWYVIAPLHGTVMECPPARPLLSEAGRTHQNSIRSGLVAPPTPVMRQWLNIRGQYVRHGGGSRTGGQRPRPFRINEQVNMEINLRSVAGPISYDNLLTGEVKGSTYLRCSSRQRNVPEPMCVRQPSVDMTCILACSQEAGGLRSMSVQASRCLKDCASAFLAGADRIRQHDCDPALHSRRLRCGL